MSNPHFLVIAFVILLCECCGNRFRVLMMVSSVDFLLAWTLLRAPGVKDRHSIPNRVFIGFLLCTVC